MGETEIEASAREAEDRYLFMSLILLSPQLPSAFSTYLGIVFAALTAFMVLGRWRGWGRK